MQQVVQEIKNLSIGFTSKKGQQISILKNINTKIKKGETVGIVGESGSGKSCLLYTSPSPRDLSTSRMPSSA